MKLIMFLTILLIIYPILAKDAKVHWISEVFAWMIFVLFQSINKIVKQDGMVIPKTNNQNALVDFSL